MWVHAYPRDDQDPVVPPETSAAQVLAVDPEAQKHGRQGRQEPADAIQRGSSVVMRQEGKLLRRQPWRGTRTRHGAERERHEKMAR